jgi:hypothetical protein
MLPAPSALSTLQGSANDAYEMTNSLDGVCYDNCMQDGKHVANIFGNFAALIPRSKGHATYRVRELLH